MAISFAQSERSTLGVEWELQLIDVDSEDLRQCAGAILSEISARYPDDTLIHGEMLRNTIELVSRKQTRVRDAIADLNEGLDLLRPVTSALRVDLTGAGSHPFANPAHQRVSDSERYAELVNRTQFWGRQMLLFGTHVHVGIEDRSKVLPLLGFLATHLGRLQALSASSPYWASTDTGYCDNRAMVFQQLPTAGVPQLFTRWEELEGYTQDMKKTGIISKFDEIRWDIRPSPRLGTLAVRVCDSASNVAEIGAITALIHCLVEYGSRILDRGEELPRTSPWFLAENKWRAARYGMDAVLIEDIHGNERHIDDLLDETVRELEPIADDLQCQEELDFIHTLRSVGVGYQRQKAVADGSGSLEAVVAHLRAETAAGRPLAPQVTAGTTTEGARSPRPGNRK